MATLWLLLTLLAPVVLCGPTPVSVAPHTTVKSNDAPTGHFYIRDGGKTGRIGDTRMSFNADTELCHGSAKDCTFIGDNSLVFLTTDKAVVHDPPNGAGLNLCVRNTRTGAQEHTWLSGVGTLSGSIGVGYFQVVTASEEGQSTSPMHLDISNHNSPVCRRLADAMWVRGKTPTFGEPGILFVGNYLYAYGRDYHPNTLNTSLHLTRVPAGSAGTRSAYRFWNGKSWVANVAESTQVTADFGGGAIYSNYFKKYLWIGTSKSRWLDLPCSQSALEWADILTL